MISDEILSALEDVLQQLFKENNVERPAQLKIGIEHPANLQFGDYSTNIAMQLARLLKRSPLAIANEIKEQLLGHPEINGLFIKVEVAAPGFINLYVDWEKWTSRAFDFPVMREPAGKVVIEHTSINPNKSAHIGHLRNSCIGDTLARMLQRTGHQVEVHNYIDDLGNQLADTVVGLLHMQAEQEFSRFGDFCWEIYARVNKTYKTDPALQQQRTVVLHDLEKGNTNIAWLGLVVAERIVKEHLDEMKQFNIGYDVLVWESSIIREGFWSETFELLKQTPVFHQETEGKLARCWVLKQPDNDSGVGDQTDFQADKVLIRSNGILTYTAKDIAYHLWKFGVLGKDFRYKKFADKLWSTHPDGVKKRIGRADTVINVIDHRQEYPQTMVKEALKALGFAEQAERLKHVGYGVVSLSPDTAAGLGVDTSDQKSSYPMSGRQGIGIKASDILDQMERIIDSKRSRKTGISSRSIAAAAIRYYLLRFNLLTEVVFDLEQATEIQGNTGVYLLYAYARSCSILDKAGGEAVRTEPAAFHELELQEYGLIRQLAYWPETLHTAAQELSPNIICTYVHELANLFNHFYATCPILKAEGPKQRIRLWLTARFKETMHDALGVLGMPTPRRM
ncbi:arginine--tRNA ligase [Paenibacillus tarimensis]